VPRKEKGTRGAGTPKHAQGGAQGLQKLEERKTYSNMI
jgi:hypothetical protein